MDIRHSVSLGFNYNVLQNLQLSVGSVWHSGQPHTNPLASNPTVQINTNYYVNYDQPNSQNVDPFFRLDASINYDFNFTKDSKLSFRAGVKNVTNHHNTINRYFEVDPEDTNNTIQIDNKSLGLTPNASLRYSF